MSCQGQDSGSLVIGVDFDNTIATYDELLHRQALEQGLISKDVAKNKMEVRDTVRMLPEGEIQWQTLQGLVYGPKMKEARICEGVGHFFHECRQRQIKVFIVSHKTEFANYDDTRTNLRQSALEWMTENRFFEIDGFGLSQEDVFFEATRREKVQRIAQLGCTHFIDDLTEVFDDDGFPNAVGKILYSPNSAGPALAGVMVADSWEIISEYLFEADGFDSDLSVGLSTNESRH